jgi:UDP-N-acetyl-2-amino-2-deoxyglucuronate dehydrogenase
MKNFALIGAAGYIAPRHMKAIKDTGNRLVAALDRSDSVGILDNYFPEADFFTEFERFDRHIEKLRRGRDDHAVDYVSIASPNYLHDAHIRFALRVGADAICEKPVVLNPWNIDALAEIERESGKRVFSILQLRLHPAIQALKKRIESEGLGTRHRIDLTYITGRGRWYLFSWKGDEAKSGGIATNIGVHFFDMLTWIFGPAIRTHVHLKTADRAAGFLELGKADVRWFLSLNCGDLSHQARQRGNRTHRCVTVDDAPLEFTEGFGDLHTRSYEEILKGNGFGLEDGRRSIEIVYGIRSQPADMTKGEIHPDALTVLRQGASHV